MKATILSTFRKVIAASFLLGWLGCIPVLGQSDENCRFSIHGTVIDRDGATPVPGATVFIRELGKGAVTDANGEYTIDHVCVGQYRIFCSFLGYETDTSHVHVDDYPVIDHDFTLHEADTQLKTVVVTGAKIDVPPLQPSEALQGMELERTRGQTLGESLKSITGVNTIQTGPSIAKPVIHGLHSNRILILNNGIRQEGQQWGSEHAPEIDPFVASKISVVKGAAGVRYGPDAIGGVILVEPAELPQTPGIGGELNLVGWTNNRQGVASGIVQGNVEKLDGLSWRLQGTVKRAGNVRTSDYFLKNTGVEELNFSSALGYHKERYGADVFFSQFNTDIGIFAGAHIGNTTDLQRAIASDRPLTAYESGFSYKIDRPYQDISHRLFKANAYWKPGNLGTITSTYAWQHNDRAEYDLHRPRGSTSNGPELQYTLNTQTGDIVWEHAPILKKINGSVGVSTIYQGNVIGGRYLIPNFRNRGIGAFAIERYSDKRWEVEAGVRYDYRYLEIFRLRNGVRFEPTYNFASFSGTVGGSYKINSSLSVKANMGTAWRPPAVNELFSDGVHHGAAAYEKGDSTLSPEKAYNLTVSGVYQSERWQAEIGLYQNTIDDYIYLMPVFPPVLTIRGAFPSFRYTQVNAVFRGIDASASYRLTPELTLTSKLSLLRARNTTTDEFLPFVPADRLENSVRYQRKTLGNLVNSFVSLTSVHVARQSRVAANTDYAPPPAGYTVFNMDAGFTIPALHNTEFGFRISNLLNTAYRDYLNRFRYYADEIGRNVSIRVKVTF